MDTCRSIPSFYVAPAGGAPGFRVFVVNKLELNGASIVSGYPAGIDNRAVAFLAKSDALLHGTITVAQMVGGSPSGCVNTGNGKGGAQFAGAEVVGGEYADTTNAKLGGGALQVFSATSVQIDGTIDITAFQAAMFGNTGGGAGGSLLLEAPMVSLTLRGAVTALGGPGSHCIDPFGCSLGGRGGTESALPMNGVDMTDNSTASTYHPGGGGGAVGRLRINTIDGTYQKDAAAVIHAAATTGTILKR